MNGERLPTVSANNLDYVDINQVPMAALARMEVLRDGGAAIYGSDAVAGVVNLNSTKITQPKMLRRVFKSCGTIDWREGRYNSGNQTVRSLPMKLADSVVRRRVKVLWTIRSEVNADWPVRNSVCEHSVRDPDREPLVCGFVGAIS